MIDLAQTGTNDTSTPVLTQGQSYMGGIVNFDTKTGAKLAPGATTPSNALQAQPAGAPKAPSTTMNAANIAGATGSSTGSVTLPPPPTGSSTEANISTLKAIPTIEQVTADVNNTPSPAATQQKSLIGSLGDLYQKMTGKAAAQTTAEDAQGLPALNNQLTDLNTQIKQLQNSADIATTRSEDRLAPTFAIQGEQAQIAHEHTIQALGLNSLASALQGNIAKAQSAADRAVATQFDPIQRQIDYQQKLLDLNKDALTHEDSQKATMLQAVLTERQSKLNEAKDDRKTILGWAAQAVANNPGNQAAQLAAQKLLDPNMSDLGTALKGISQFLSDPNAVANAVADLNLTRAQTASANASAANANASAGKTAQETKNLRDANLPQPGMAPYPQDVQSFVTSHGLNAQQQAAFSAVPPQDQATVMQLINGGALLADVIKSRGAQATPQIKAMLSQIAKIDPSWTPNQNKLRYDFIQDWNNPNAKSNITRNAINTGMEHGATAFADAQALKNAQSKGFLGFQTPLTKQYNSMANMLADSAGHPEISNYNFDITLLATELATAYKGGVPTDPEIAAQMNALTANLAPDQFQGVFDRVGKLMSSKIANTAEEYKKVMGSYPPAPVINPEAVAQLKQSGVDVKPIENVLLKQGYKTPISLMDPKTKQVKTFDLNAADLQDALTQGYLRQ